MNYERNKNYFRNAFSQYGTIINSMPELFQKITKIVNILMWVFFGLGLLLLIMGLALKSGILIPMGIAYAVIGIIGALVTMKLKKKKLNVQTSGVSTGAAIDEEVREFARQAEDKALDHLGVDEDEVAEADPITFEQYVFGDGIAAVADVTDGKWRSEKYKVVKLYFSAHEMHCYVCEFSLTEPKTTYSTKVYFYKDIISIFTEAEETKQGTASFTYDVIKLTTAGGTTFTLGVNEGEETSRSLRALKSLLRAKKAE